MQPTPRRHRLGSAVQRAALVAVVAAVTLIAAACVDPVTDPVTDPPSTADPDEDRALDSDPESRGSGPQNRLPGELSSVPDECSAEVEAAAVDTVATQLDDFARGDYAAALSRATSAFRSGIDVPAFRTLIEDGYPLLVQEATAELLRCSWLGVDTVEVDVEVTTSDRVSAPFAYRLRLDDDRWAIDAAVRLTPPPATA